MPQAHGGRLCRLLAHGLWPRLDIPRFDVARLIIDGCAELILNALRLDLVVTLFRLAAILGLRATAFLTVSLVAATGSALPATTSASAAFAASTLFFAPAAFAKFAIFALPTFLATFTIFLSSAIFLSLAALLSFTSVAAISISAASATSSATTSTAATRFAFVAAIASAFLATLLVSFLATLIAPFSTTFVATLIAPFAAAFVSAAAFVAATARRLSFLRRARLAGGGGDRCGRRLYRRGRFFFNWRQAELGGKASPVGLRFLG
jgi:hypothetical protein